MTWPRSVALCTIVAGAACGNIETPTSATAVTAVAPATVVFSGTLAPHGSRFYSYTVTTSGTVTAMLASVVPGGGVAPAGNRLELALGIPAGTGCSSRMVDNVAPAFVPQLTQAAAAGTYCVSVTDLDGLPAPVNFAVRITYP